jgi:hypothetical protein
VPDPDSTLQLSGLKDCSRQAANAPRASGYLLRRMRMSEFELRFARVRCRHVLAHWRLGVRHQTAELLQTMQGQAKVGTSHRIEVLDPVTVL